MNVVMWVRNKRDRYLTVFKTNFWFYFHGFSHKSLLWCTQCAQLARRAYWSAVKCLKSLSNRLFSRSLDLSRRNTYAALALQCLLNTYCWAKWSAQVRRLMINFLCWQLISRRCELKSEKKLSCPRRRHLRFEYYPHCSLNPEYKPYHSFGSNICIIFYVWFIICICIIHLVISGHILSCCLVIMTHVCEYFSSLTLRQRCQKLCLVMA